MANKIYSALLQTQTVSLCLRDECFALFFNFCWGWPWRFFPADSFLLRMRSLSSLVYLMHQTSSSDGMAVGPDHAPRRLLFDSVVVSFRSCLWWPPVSVFQEGSCSWNVNFRARVMLAHGWLRIPSGLWSLEGRCVIGVAGTWKSMVLGTCRKMASRDVLPQVVWCRFYSCGLCCLCHSLVSWAVSRAVFPSMPSYWYAYCKGKHSRIQNTVRYSSHIISISAFSIHLRKERK